MGADQARRVRGPGGTGGGADQWRGSSPRIAEKHKITHKPFIVQKPGGAGAEGFLHVKGKTGDDQTIIITLYNLFTTPLDDGCAIQLEGPHPDRRLALDGFVLWVNAETPYKTAKEYLDAAKEDPGGHEDGRHRGESGRPDRDHPAGAGGIGAKLTYVPFKGGGEVCVDLVGKHVDSTVNNPSECVSHWRAGGCARWR